MKNAVTKSLDDPILEAMPVIPTDRMADGCRSDQPADSGLICAGTAAPARTGGDRHRSGQPPDQPQGRAQCPAAIALVGGLLRRLRTGGPAKSIVRLGCTSERAGRLSGRCRILSTILLPTTTSD